MTHQLIAFVDRGCIIDAVRLVPLVVAPTLDTQCVVKFVYSNKELTLMTFNYLR